MKKLISILVLCTSFLFIGCDNAMEHGGELAQHIRDLGYGPYFDAELVDGYHGTDKENTDKIVIKVKVGNDYQYAGIDITDFHDFEALFFATNDLAQRKTILENYIGARLVGLTYNWHDHNFYRTSDGSLFSENVASIKDLETIGSRLQQLEFNSLSEKLVANYGLSEERGQKVAKLVGTYQKISSKRSLTLREKNQFSNELLGVEFDKAQQAFIGLAQGDSKDFNSLLEMAAGANGTSPEHVSAILNELFL